MKLLKIGVEVKVKDNIEVGQYNGVYFNEEMLQYRGKTFKVVYCWRQGEQVMFNLENASDWTFTYDFIEEVSEEDMTEEIFTCYECGEEFTSTEELEYIDGHYVCRNCCEEYYFECEDCNEVHHVDERHYVGEYDDIEVCDYCFDNYYRECEECGHYFNTDYMYYRNGYYYCENCYDNARDMICSYHDYDRGFEFLMATGEIKPPFYIGAELEMENDNVVADCIRYLKDKFDAILSHDGSLETYGAMEWVMDPHSPLSWHEQANDYKTAFKMLVDNGYRSHDTSTCGLHFHVSRPYQEEIDSLGYSEEENKKREELYKKQETAIERVILVLETYKEEFIKFSRRKSMNWCQWLSDVVTNESGKITSLDFIKNNKYAMEGHHRALNLENHNTIEFRIFKGTLNFDTFMASLELVNNIATLCFDLNIPLEKITWKKLTSGEYVSKYVQDNNIFTNRKVVDTSEVDKIWAIIKNRRKGKVAKKIFNLMDKYYKHYLDRFDEVKNTEEWSKITDIASKLREYTGAMKQAVDYKNNAEYDNLFYKLKDMINYNMYFDNDYLCDILASIRDLFKEVQ